MNIYKDIIKQLHENQYSIKELQKLKVDLCRKYNINKIPSNTEILLNATTQDIKKINLMTKPVRTISGVAVLALMTAPMYCPKKEPCYFCPGGPKSVFGNVPQSYTGNEPASLRGIRNNYDPYLQVFNRLEQYIINDHCPEKVEIIIMGGTFPAVSKNYQEYFIKYVFKALNDFSILFFTPDLNISRFKEFFELPGNLKDKERTSKIQNKILKTKNDCNLEEEQIKNETAKIRCVTLCLETKPDYSKEQQIDYSLKLGTTRIELGVQSLSNKILEKVNREHTIEDTIKATQLLKDSFLKVTYHIMLGLPLSTPENDILMFKQLFENPDFKPDALKIYPCRVFKGTKIYEWWLSGNYKPITTEQAADIIIKAKQYIPKYCRIMRINRDIPSHISDAGVDKTNLRQIIQEKMIKQNIKCNCIRCREPKNRLIDWHNVKLAKQYYLASSGNEVFLSYEDLKNDILLGFCRLRIPFKPFRKEITENSAGIRELHIYGTSTSLKEQGIIQHQGLGKNLLSEAEKIAKEEFDSKKMIVISGIGVKGYYKKFGYKKDGLYVSKII